MNITCRRTFAIREKPAKLHHTNGHTRGSTHMSKSHYMTKLVLHDECGFCGAIIWRCVSKCLRTCFDPNTGNFSFLKGVNMTDICTVRKRYNKVTREGYNQRSQTLSFQTQHTIREELKAPGSVAILAEKIQLLSSCSCSHRCTRQ